MKTQQELIDVLTEQAEQAEAKLEKAENYAKGLFVILEKAEVDNRTLLEQLQKAEAELADIRDAHVLTGTSTRYALVKYCFQERIAPMPIKVMSEICPADEAHCTCVPILRRELAEAKPFMDAVKSLHNGYSGDPLFEIPKNPRAAIKQLVGEAEALGLAESKLYKAELAELRDATAWYFECFKMWEYSEHDSEFYDKACYYKSGMSYNNRFHSATDEIYESYKHAEQQLRSQVICQK